MSTGTANTGTKSPPMLKQKVSFSAFLLDELPDFNDKSSSSLPPLKPYIAPTAVTVKQVKPSDDIPVLEAGKRRSSVGFTMYEGNDDDDEEDYEEAYEYDENANDDYVPVLQTVEDAQAFDAMNGQKPAGAKKFSWHQSTRRVRKTSKSSRKHSVTVPDPETLLRMSSRPTELMTYSSSGSLVSGRASSITVDRQLIRSGWLFKQANVWKTWKRRYFVLVKRTNTTTGEYSASLQYYKGNNFGKLRGEVNLQDGPITVRFLETYETKRPYCFEVARGDDSFICQGWDDEDVSAWVCHLQSLSGNGGELPPSASLVGTAAASGLQSRGPMDDRSIRIVAELRRLLHTSKSSEAAQCKSFVKNFEYRSPSALRQFREFHASITDSIVKDHASRILRLLKDPNATDGNSADRQGSLPISVDDIRSAVARHVEEVLFAPLQDNINIYLRRAYHEDESAINRKVRWLQGKDQTYFNIPLHQMSWKEWRKASKVLSQLAMVALPSAKYDVLVNTITEIQLTYAEEHNKLVDVEPLETDDIIPIFTYVLSNSGLENLLSLKALLTELSGSWATGKDTEEDYTLSIFNHAVEFISNVSIPAVLEDIFKDQITLSIDGDWRRVLDIEVEPTYRYGAVVQHVHPNGVSAVGSTVTRGHVLVTINGQNVVLWPYLDILNLLRESTSPHRLAFIPGHSYFKILTANKSLWNVALIHACQRGDVSSVQMLLANGADVNYVAHESGSNTPLHVAVSSLHYNVVSYLLQHGAKVKTLGEYGRSVLHMIGLPCCLPAPSSSTLAVSVGNSLRSSKTPSFRPSEKVVMIMKKLIAHGAQLDTMDIYGNTPLMLLGEAGCLHGIDVMVEADSHLNLNARNWQRGMSALTFAAKEGHLDVVEALLDYGAQANICTLRGETALHFAAAVANNQICQILIEKGCKVDARTSIGLTPLMVAVAKGQVMTKNVAKPILPSKHKRYSDDTRNSLHVDNPSVIATIDFFLENGADKTLVCELYRLPLHYAGLYGGDDIYQYVLSKMRKGDGEKRDIYGQSANEMAEASRFADDGNMSPKHDDEDGPGESDEDDDQLDDDDDDDDDDEDDIPMSLGQCQDTNGGSLMTKNLVTEDNDGVLEVVAGTFHAIADLLLRYDCYRLEEVDALVWHCNYDSNYIEMIDFLRDVLKRHMGSDEKFYVVRMVLHTLDKMVENIKHKMECNMDVCKYISTFCEEIFPFDAAVDPQCAQWLSDSLLPSFVESCNSNRMQEFQILSFCEEDYTSLKHFICSAKQNNPMLKFLDDELFGTATGMEIISENMRRRLSIAGVWSGDTKKSFVIKNEPNERTPSERMTTITPWQPRGVTLGRNPSSERMTRLWLLDLDASIIAQQITLLQHYLFSKIKVSEILASKKNAATTPAYQRLRLLHNHISVWVVSLILERDDVDQRAEILSYFIKVAGVLLSPLQNLDGFMAVMNATNDSSIFRLKKTWGRLSPQARDLWHDLKKYTENGARPLNKLQKESTPPLIPYLGVVLQNVLAMQEFPDRVEGDLINFKKIRFIGSLIRRLLFFQKIPYLLPTENRVLEHLCCSMQYPDAETCFARSLKIEPRVAAASGSA